MKSVKRIELVELYNAIKNMDSSVKYDKWFVYATSVNLTKIEDEVKLILEANKIPEEYYEFEKKRQDIFTKYANKDENGEPVVNETGAWSFASEITETLRDEIEILIDEYKDILKETERERDDFDLFLSDEVEVDIREVSIDRFPDQLSPQEMKALLIMAETV